MEVVNLFWSWCKQQVVRFEQRFYFSKIITSLGELNKNMVLLRIFIYRVTFIIVGCASHFVVNTTNNTTSNYLTPQNAR